MIKATYQLIPKKDTTGEEGVVVNHIGGDFSGIGDNLLTVSYS